MDRRLFPAPQDWQVMRDGFSWAIPEKMNIAQHCCDDWAAAAPEQVAVIHLDGAGGRQCWTYGQLKRASDGLAVALAARGVGPGDRVAILLAQHPYGHLDFFTF